MPLYLRPKLGGSTVAIGYCQRCRKKYYLDELSPDGDSPGLMVCDPCNDMLDPYKLPRRKSEDVGLKRPLPPDPAAVDTDSTLTTEYGDDILFPPNITLE